MKKNKIKCSDCPYHGYSKEICTMHHMKMGSSFSCGEEECGWLFLGKKAVLGAGVGITGAVAGMAVLPALGMKAILGHILALKVSGAGGVVGAGTNLAAKRHKKPEKTKRTKKRALLMPSHFGGVPTRKTKNIT